MKDEVKESGMRLLKKGKQTIFKIIFSRSGIILALLLLQVLFLFTIFRWFEAFLPHIYGGVVIFTVFMVLYLLNSPLDPSAKISWLVCVMLMPVFGALLFLYTQKNIGHNALKQRYAALNRHKASELQQDPDVLAKLRKTDPGVAALANYVARSGYYPIYQNTDVKYFPLGEDKFKEMLLQLQQAKDYIFLEYFIISEGRMWGEILDILARKAADGLDVRVLYDGTCELSTLPHDYPQRLAKLGIKCKMFAPIKPFVSTHYNYRDHRKILVIDGKVAFTGGINLADEYINDYEKHGHWKDTAIMLHGDAVQSFTRMFLHMWNLDQKHVSFRESQIPAKDSPRISNSFVMPYGDCPLDDVKLGRQVYIDILNRAKDYVYITTPYLIIDGELENALKYAAERGVDVRIILPGVPDKSLPFALAFTHYRTLLESGVKIFEYTPGFVHAKMFLSDDREAVVGTINLDYRSLYHHFECASYIYGAKCLKDIKADMLATEAKSRQQTLKTIKNESFKRRFLGFIAKAVAPLM